MAAGHALVEPDAFDQARERAGEIVDGRSLPEGHAEVSERGLEHLLQAFEPLTCSSKLGRRISSLHRPYGTALSQSAHRNP